jgi:hypothetical protein
MFWIKMAHDRRCFDDWSVAYEMAASEVRAGAPALKIPLQTGEFQKAPWEPANPASSIELNQILAARIPRSDKQRNLSA